MFFMYLFLLFSQVDGPKESHKSEPLEKRDRHRGILQTVITPQLGGLFES